MSRSVPFRQIHLDFHTSASCENVAADFDPDDFAETFASAHVESVNVFAKCHHGYSYYDTGVGTRHPHLARNLLADQINALQARGIRAPIYLSLQWDDLAAERMPASVVVRSDGSLLARPPLSAEAHGGEHWSWSSLDLSSSYGDYVCAQVEELCSLFRPDGFWFDICMTMPNYSPWSRAEMTRDGIDWADAARVEAWTDQRLLRFMERLSDVVRSRASDATIVFNHATDLSLPDKLGFHSHVEVESLATTPGKWGYLHYPIVARWVRSFDAPFVGMTGRFHRSWADFGGLKSRKQLEYEIGTILAAGGRVSIGDQLHPSGRLDEAVYRLIGHAYSRVKELESWLVDAIPTREIGVISTGVRVEPADGVVSCRHSGNVQGAAQMLLEAGLQFDIVSPHPEILGRYAAIIVSDGVHLGPSEAAAVDAYVRAGGRIVVTGSACLDPAIGRFPFEWMPVEYIGPSPTIPSYFRIDPSAWESSRELAADYDYVVYGAAHMVRAKPGAAAYGDLKRALFNRTPHTFTSHEHAPVGGSLKCPLVVSRANVLYFAAPLFLGYRDADYWPYREVAIGAMRSFLPEPLIRVSGPSWIEASVLTQARGEGVAPRLIVHLVSYTPRRTMQGVPHIDDAADTRDVVVQLATPRRRVSRVYSAPGGEDLSFVQSGDVTAVEVKTVGTHTVLVVE